jgi:hypothetical protein
MRSRSRPVALPVLLLLASQTGCLKGALAPHLSREAELAPAAASDRFGTVLDKATAFERQNEKSRDVYWYRLWRASAMIEMGQTQDGLQLIDEVMREVAVAGKTPAQPDRFRMFALDLQARGMLVLDRPAEALPLLERALGLAQDVGLETRSDCDREIMLASRKKQIEEVAARAGDGDRASSVHAEVERHLDRWTKCLTSRDFPGMRALSSLTEGMKKNGTTEVAAAPVAIPPPAVAIAPPPPAPPPPAAKVLPPPPAPPAAAPEGSWIASLSRASDRFAPIDATPYQGGLDAVLPLVRKHAGKGASGSIAIRSDGKFRALRLELPRALQKAEELEPLFEATVVFFEQTRSVQPGVDRVILATKEYEAMATKADIFELFVDKIDVRTFVSRLQRLR